MHRAILFARPLGPWRETAAEACADAREAGEARRYKRTGRMYLSPGVAIVTDEPTLRPKVASNVGAVRQRAGLER